ncbi:hypothetical protein GCM10009665_27830 [Kitasatospora nipponensis]|uniref:Formiminotransferase-cyclodeaminase n=1 Tax=Kitasatospora nipponensis TaxID=258049 RepID=A0ABN1W5F6_9ACTN
MTERSEGSWLSEVMARSRREATDAAQELRSVLAAADLALPSVALDGQSPFTGVVLVDLGRARAEVVAGIATLLREGLSARAQQQL